MTNDQWDSIRVLMFALAKTSEKPEALRVAFQSQKEVLEAYLRNSKMAKVTLEAHLSKLSEIEKAVWE